jgi:Zn-finger nucleic acid-binding protein
MEPVVFDGIEVDRCTACKGLWFDSREDEKLRARRGSAVIDTGDRALGRAHNDVRDVRCPRCTSRLVRMVDAAQPHIWYEGCAVCGGAYFDAGEFRDSMSRTLLDVFRDWFARERK